MGYPQGPTPVETDNSPAEGFINETQKETKSRVIKMNFYWLRDKVKNKEFYFFWRSGKLNWANYHSKHHPIWYHRVQRPIILHPNQADIMNSELGSLQGCVRITTDRHNSLTDGRKCD